jgi:hypothetical protein
MEEKKHGVVWKIFLIMLLEIVFTLFAAFLAGWLAYSEIQTGWSIAFTEIITTVIIIIISTYLAMLSLSRIFVAEDIKLIPKWMAIITLIWAVFYLITDHTMTTSLLNFIIGPTLTYLIAYSFLKFKFKKT